MTEAIIQPTPSPPPQKKYHASKTVYQKMFLPSVGLLLIFVFKQFYAWYMVLVTKG